MTSRISSPDTDADKAVRDCLGANPPISFVMVAGAGSGKTTSLVKALQHVVQERGSLMRQTGQRIACVTYTEVAVEAISGDVGHSTICHVSTIHSFLWTLIRPFVPDIKEWLLERIREKSADEQAKLDKPRTQAATKLKAKVRLERYAEQTKAISALQRFTYSTGSDYGRGVLGHDDVVRCALSLLGSRPLLAKLLAANFPIVFVDESQDTNPDFVAALKAIKQAVDTPFCVGFFGDPMQKIYLAGVGAIKAEAGWQTIEKEENFRAPQAVLRLINRIRQDDDKLVQVRGRLEGPEPQKPVEGTARIFLLPADTNRTASLQRVREWTATKHNDQAWLTTSENDAVKLLVLVHRSAATRLGFQSVFAALNDFGDHGLKQGLRDGSAWILRPFLSLLLPLVDARRGGREREIVHLLNSHSPALEEASTAAAPVGQVLAKLDSAIERLAKMLSGAEQATVQDVLRLAADARILSLDDRFGPLVTGVASAQPAEADADDTGEEASARAFLAAPAAELVALRRYIENQSPFDTHQGIKGAEFDRVLVVLDDDESNYNLFSYGRYFGLEPPSDTDLKNAKAGKETTTDRTRRLFYVCCSRARLDLAVALFVAAPDAAKVVLMKSDLFPQAEVRTLSDIS